MRKAEVAWSAREENRKRPGRRFLPFEDTYLFHSELASGARHEKSGRQQNGTPTWNPVLFIY